MRIAVLSTMIGAGLVAADGQSQAVVSQTILSMATAKLVAETALTACTSRGFHTSVAVVDRSGNVVVLLRDELAHPMTTEMAQRKAQTAVVFRASTLEFQQRTANDPSLAPQRDVPGILALGGGVPIRFNGEIIGGVASSGSSQTTDPSPSRRCPPAR